MTEAEAAPVPSPCVGICELDADEVCVGCGRTIAEIAAWGGMSERERQAVRDRIDAERRATGR